MNRKHDIELKGKYGKVRLWNIESNKYLASFINNVDNTTHFERSVYLFDIGDPCEIISTIADICISAHNKTKNKQDICEN